MVSTLSNVVSGQGVPTSDLERSDRLVCPGGASEVSCIGGDISGAEVCDGVGLLDPRS